MHPARLVTLVGALILTTACGGRPEGAIVVGSKNFTESVVLGEILAQALEARGVPVVRKLNLGGTFVCHRALVAGQLDTYVEYTGTAYAAILELPPERNQDSVRARLAREYRERWGLTWAAPLGFNNTFAMLVRGETARHLRLRTFSDAVPYAPAWRAGFGFEFAARADGLPGLLERYGFRFEREPAAMDLGLMYRALADSQVDLIAGNSTDGQIEALDLVHLEDDRGYFPIYDAVPVARRASLERVPALGAVFEELGGRIDEAAMRRMNFLVDTGKRDVAAVARDFLAGLGVSSRTNEP